MITACTRANRIEANEFRCCTENKHGSGTSEHPETGLPIKAAKRKAFPAPHAPLIPFHGIDPIDGTKHPHAGPMTAPYRLPSRTASATGRRYLSPPTACFPGRTSSVVPRVKPEEPVLNGNLGPPPPFSLHIGKNKSTTGYRRKFMVFKGYKRYKL